MLVEWLPPGLFTVEVLNSASAWRAEHCSAPLEDAVNQETWLDRAYEAFGFEAAPSTEYWFEFSDLTEPGTKELRWYWSDQGLKSGFVDLRPADVAESTQRILSVGCDLSRSLTLLTKESRSTQAQIEKEMDAVRKEVKEAVRSRRTIYARCAALIKEKNEQLKELLEKQGESLVGVENEDPYSSLTHDQEANFD